MFRGIRHGLLAVTALAAFAVAGCSGGGGGGSNSGTGGTPTPATEALTVAISTNSVGPGVPATVTATLTLGGAPVANEVLTFSTDTNYGTFTPASGTTLTDSSGVARMTLNAGTTSGASTVTVQSRNGTKQTVNYLVSATAGGTTAGLSLSSLATGVQSLSAYGTTSVSVSVLSGGALYQPPVDVTFSSTCASASAPRATVTSKVTTVNGVATAQYKDNGCNATDTITASTVGATSVTGSLVVLSPSIGSIQFIDATPTVLALKGTGGAGLSETSLVRFKVVDQAGQPIKASVKFALSTSVGGVALTSNSATSDATTGLVSTNVNSGTVATPVRVTATILDANGAATALSTQSDKLSISTGLPDQAHFSLAAEVPNIEGWDFDGSTTSITARASDHFSNPVPDGTVVNFIAEGSSVQPQCTTTGGACSVTFTSQALRPTNGRVSVLAYAIGEEAFVDLNGDGYINSLSEFIDANGTSADMPEAFVDFNENGVRDANEPFVDFNNNGVYDAPDGAYNGKLCNSAATPTLCSAQQSLNVFRNRVIVLSGSTAVITLTPPATPIDLGHCGGTQTITAFIRDIHGNPMPAGTTVTFAADDGTVVGVSSYTVLGTTVQPTDPNYAFFLKGDGTIDPNTGSCKDQTNAGSATVTVKTPKGIITTASVAVMN